MSSGLNTLAGTIYEDFLALKMPKDITEKRISDIMKIISVILGLVCMGFVFLVQFMGGLFALTLKVSALAGGPILAMFTLGMLTPFVNTKGILYGILGGILGVAWLLFGNIYYDLSGQLVNVSKPLSTEECPFNITASTYNQTLPYEDLPPYPFRITFYYYSLIGAIVTTFIAVPVSLMTGGRDQVINRDLLSPVVHPFISERHESKKKQEEKKKQAELTVLNIIKVPDGFTKEDVIGNGKFDASVVIK